MNEQNLNDIGTIFRDRRKELGLSQRALAKQLGISHVAIGQIERGKNNPGLFTYQALCKALSLDSETLEPIPVKPYKAFTMRLFYYYTNSLFNTRSLVAPVTLEEISDFIHDAYTREPELFAVGENGVLDSA